ncbi:MAG: hypothetical protein II922_12280 [Succinimonas sp.]|nr:hypothetical protein [Succinimonas sp.]
MSVILESFPKLTTELKTCIGFCPSPYEFFYIDNNNEKCPLQSEITNVLNTCDILQLTDEKSDWHPNDYALGIKVSFSIRTPSHLFGENGLVSQDGGIIGVGIMWDCQEASIRGVFDIGEISSDNNSSADFSKEIEIPKALLRGLLHLRIMLYVKQHGTLNDIPTYQSTTPGTVLGYLHETKVIISGNGNIFPVILTSDNSENAPLWWVKCAFDPCEETPFNEDSFCLYINKSHVDYSLILSSGNEMTPLMREVMGSALTIFFSTILEENNVFENLKSTRKFESGSVASVASFIIDRFDLNLSWPVIPEKLAYEIRQKILPSFR